MTITQQQYDAYVRAENNYYLQRFTTRKYESYDAVENLLDELSRNPRIGGTQRTDIQDFLSFYRYVSSSEKARNPIYRLDLKTSIDNFITSSTFTFLKGFFFSPGVANTEDVFDDFGDLLDSIEDTPPFVAPGESPANFYQTYIDELQSQLDRNRNNGPSPGGNLVDNNSTGTEGSSTTSPTPNCYEKNGVVMTIGNESFYLKLLPAIQSNIPMQGSSETPNTAPGLHIKIIPNLARLRIPGFAPVYQHLGIDSALITLVGTFVPEDGEDIESFTNVTGFAPPENINDQTAYNQIRNSELERSSYLAATKFYDFAVKTGGEVSVFINVPENVNLDNNPFVLDTKPGFKGIIKSMDLFHRNLYRTWYTIQFEVSDFGMYSSTPLDMNRDISDAIQEQVEQDTQQRLQETRSDLSDLIDGRPLISYNSRDPGYFRSEGSYYFRFADPQSCRGSFLSADIISRCDNEQWVRITGIDRNQAAIFADSLDPAELPSEANIEYPSYEIVRQARRRGYQQFNKDGSPVIRTRRTGRSDYQQFNDNQSEVPEGEIAKMVVKGSNRLSSNLAADSSVGVTATSLASSAPDSFIISAGNFLSEVGLRRPDSNKDSLESVVFPLNSFRGSSVGVNEAALPPSTALRVDVSTPTVDSELSTPSSTVPTPTPDPLLSGSFNAPNTFLPPTSPTVSAVTSSVSTSDMMVLLRGGVYLSNAQRQNFTRVFFTPSRIALNEIMSHSNISSIKVDISSTPNLSDVRSVNINESGAFVGSEEVINFINTNSNRLTATIRDQDIVLSVP